MNVLVFGNKDYAPDAVAFMVVERLQRDFESLVFIEVKPNEDLPYVDGAPLLLLDVVEGISKVTEITEKNVGQLVQASRSTAHDYDLGFQLKYLTKLGKILRFTIVGIPMQGALDYDSIQLIFKKLVAQDIQGS